MRRVLVLALALLPLGCDDGERPPPVTSGGGGASSAPAQEDGLGGFGGATSACAQGLDVFFVGNSYTYQNDLPVLIAGLAQAAGCGWTASQSTPGGVSLSQHLQNQQTLDALAAGGWDVVVLQDQSQTPSQPPEVLEQEALPSAEQLAQLAREGSPQARLVFYVTWGRENGDGGNCAADPRVCTFEGHTQALLEGYSIYAEATGAELALVGPAWRAVVEDAAAPAGAADLWTSDGSHPSVGGSYLAASVFFQQLYGAPPPSGFDGAVGSELAAYYRGVPQMLEDPGQEP